MQASYLTSRLKRRLAVRNWAWWQLPSMLRAYVAAGVLAAAVIACVAAFHTSWRLDDGIKFLLLACCGTISIASTPKMAYTNAGATRDFSAVWVVPTAILLPPFYAAVMPIPLILTLQFFVHRGVFYRRVFTIAALSVSYVAASAVFRLFPPTFAGGSIGTGIHAFTWAVAVVACEIIGGRAHHFMIIAGVKLQNPKVNVWEIEWNREALQGLFVELDLAVLITLAVGLTPVLVIIALPTVLLVRRFIIFPIIEAQSRVDAKTGLLNVTTWESEAEAELSRTIRNRYPVSIALVDIDHFKRVNDTYGHLAGDRVLKAIAEALTGQSRDYDRTGRFGGEEFVLLLAQTTEKDACKIAERLRGYVASLAIPVDDRPGAPTVNVTISIGVTAMPRGEIYEITDLLAAADSAMYAAKQAGRNRVAFAPPLHDMGLDTDWTPDADRKSVPRGNGTNPAASRRAGTPLAGSPLTSHHVVLVKTDQTAASLCPRR